MRLNGQLDDLRKCRWLQLGRRLGLAKEPARESAFGRDPLLLEPFPDEAERHLSIKAKSKAPPSNHESLVEHTNERFLEQCRDFAIDVVLDVGANTGQFAQALRAQGYHGHIVSFEPLSDAHAALVAAADSDPLWDVAERCAIGAQDGWAEINISAIPIVPHCFPCSICIVTQRRSRNMWEMNPAGLSLSILYIEQTFSDPTTLFGRENRHIRIQGRDLAGLKTSIMIALRSSYVRCP